MKKSNSLSVASLAMLAIAGCGTSSSSPVKPAAPATPTTSASSAPGSSGYASSSPYGSGGASTTAAAGPTALITTKQSKLGTILAVGTKRLTVYMFQADRGSASSCNGACAQAWPPVIGTPRASGGASTADLGTITRSDGRTQLTYKGHPLYTFVKDKDDGDAYGQAIKAFGADWYVLRPSGAKVDES